MSEGKYAVTEGLIANSVVDGNTATTGFPAGRKGYSVVSVPFLEFPSHLTTIALNRLP
jgi:hypothetical protein